LVLRSHNIRSGRLDLHDRSYTDEDHYRHRSRRAELRAGDLVITREAPMGEVCMIPPGLRCCLGQRMVLLRPDRTKCDPRFLLYALQSPSVQHQIGWSEGTGSTVSNLRIPHLEALRIPTPELDEQRAVGATLASLDNKIEHNRRTRRALEGLARAMFKAWFVDFEPVHAKAAGATSFPGMPPEAFAAFPTHFTDSQRGLVPEGWEVRPIGELVSVKGGATPSTKVAEYWDGGTHHWATPKDLSGLQDPVLLRTERQITEAGVECISSGVLPVDTVLLSSRAPVGYTALAKAPVAVNQGFIAMVCEGALPPHYILQWTRSVMEEIKSRASGTTFPEISKAGFRPIPAVVPTPLVVAAFESIARSIFDLITANARASRKLAELRDYLLPKLLSGAVRVKASTNVTTASLQEAS
jgi:type I restriction enzyme, S subunit